MDFILVI